MFARRFIRQAGANIGVRRNTQATVDAKSPLGVVRNDWTYEEVKEIYDSPLLELVFEAATVHRMHFDPRQVQQCTLLSIKTGGCTEDCKYCSQSSHYKTFVKPTPTMKVRTLIPTLDSSFPLLIRLNKCWKRRLELKLMGVRDFAWVRLGEKLARKMHSNM